MSREPDMALLMNAYGSLARRQILASISSEHCQTANTSRTALQGYHSCRFRVHINSTVHWPSQCRIRLFLQLHLIPISSCVALMKMHLKYENFMALLAKKAPYPWYKF